jgi:hypothetical protein
MASEGGGLRTILAYVGLTAAVALVTGAALLSYNVTQSGQSMSGVIVDYDEAALDVASQPGASSTLKIHRVVAPGPSWIVVSQVTMGATRGMMSKPDPNAAPAPEPRILAIVAVPKGEARDVIATLEPGVPLTQMLSVVLHADRGVIGTYEFDMNRFAESPDKPYFRESEDGVVHTPLQLGQNVEVQ